jgi:hypothetical protein
MSSKRKNRTLKWRNENPIIQHNRQTLARPEWKLRPTKGSPRATEVNWSNINEEEQNEPPPTPPPDFVLAPEWAPLINEGITFPKRMPTANEKIYGVRPTKLPAKATLPRLRASRKLPPKSALSHTENGGPQFMFGDHLRQHEGNKVRNLRPLEANIKRAETRPLNESSQRQARMTMGFNVPAPGVMRPEYNEVPNDAVSYALNLTKEGYPLKSDHFTPRGWAKWKTGQKGRNWKHPNRTPIPEPNGSTTPGGTPNTPGRRTRHVKATLERLGYEPSVETPGGTFVAHSNARARASNRPFNGTPGFFSD